MGAVGTLTGFTLVGYFTPIKELWGEFWAWNLGPWESFWIFFYGFHEPTCSPASCVNKYAFTCALTHASKA